MKPSDRKVVTALVIVLMFLILGTGFVLLTRVDNEKELRAMQLSMAKYLLCHGERWPQPADPDYETWWRTPGTDRMKGTFEVAQIEATPNMAFYRTTKAWLTYTTKKGERYEALPDGSIKVGRKP